MDKYGDLYIKSLKYLVPEYPLCMMCLGRSIKAYVLNIISKAGDFWHYVYVK